MTQKDLQELEQAARAIVAVVERNRVSDETAAERRAKFVLLPGGSNSQEQEESIFENSAVIFDEKEILKMEKDTKEKVTADEMMDDLIYLAELIDFMGITSWLAVRGTLSERMTDKLTDSIAGMADEVLEKWEDYQDKTE